MIRHLIVFNAREGADYADVLGMAEKGREVLSQIPGVLQVSFGTAVKENARYLYYLAIDFADKSVIQSYQDHPLHVAFADGDFRPLAPDRITTDFEILF